MEKPYHKYVFDQKNRLFIGDFENMYQNEDVQSYDSWFQDDLNHLTKKLVSTLLARFNFDSIVDFGCGKGTFTHLLQKENNEVIGIDISETAIKKARAKYPKIDFRVGNSDSFAEIEYVDLVLAIEVLSYLENWKEILSVISRKTKYFLISVYIPLDPIGYIKSLSDLELNLMQDFTIETKLIVNDNSCIFLLKSKVLNK
jgi:2-polyprenyl-3-methyl-5-hydroxy-6-metoxy-1,4-benzoquinol methylase